VLRFSTFSLRFSFFVIRFSFFLVTLSSCARSTPPAIAPVSPGSCRSAGLEWHSPEDPSQRARLDSWCAGVGPAAIHGTPATAGPGAIGIEDITFVSWNVHVGNGDVRAFVRDLTSGAHTGGRAVGHYVLMLQEAVRTSGVPPLAPDASGAARIAPHAPPHPVDIVAISRELGLSLIYVPSMRNGASPHDPAEDRGNAILSTLPLSEPVAVELPGERQRRVVIIAKAATISLAVVHLDALGGARRLRVFWTPWMRDVQVRSAAATLPDGPLVIGGDLNTWHGRDEFAARFLDREVGVTPLTVDRVGLGLRVLDYMFFRAGPDRRARYHQVESLYGSDHRPLVGWVE
jgi:endonuclease/exonuclease/phosphatase family metal-dependent hydrolase